MIRKRYVFASLLVLLCALSPFAHAHTYKVSAIIDTDMALDDIRALAMVLNSDLNIHSLHIPQEKSLLFDQNLYNKIKGMHTHAARIVTFLHDTPVITELLEDGHFRVWDEITIIYLNYPSLFELVSEEESARVMVLEDFRTDLVEQAYLKLLDYSADLHQGKRIFGHFFEWLADLQKRLFQDKR